MVSGNKLPSIVSRMCGEYDGSLLQDYDDWGHYSDGDSQRHSRQQRSDSDDDPLDSDAFYNRGAVAAGGGAAEDGVEGCSNRGAVARKATGPAGKT